MSIKSAREKAGKKISDVARFMGVSEAAVYQWESGQYTPRPAKLVKLAWYLGCSVDELLRKE